MNLLDEFKTQKLIHNRVEKKFTSTKFTYQLLGEFTSGYKPEKKLTFFLDYLSQITVIYCHYY